MMKMNFTNNQTAFEYVLYMIAASYFNKTVCLSEITERNMLLQYKEQPVNKQYRMEDICIDYMDKLIEKLPKKIFDRNMDVKLNILDTGMTEILFMDDESIVAFRGIYAGKQSQIQYQIWSKKSDKSKAKTRTKRSTKKAA